MTDEELLQEAVYPLEPLDDVVITRLRKFAGLVEKWNPSINVVAKSTMQDLWRRHIVDSAQLFSCASPDDRLWLDIGSGGGFPGIVIAALAKDLLPDLRVVLVESDKRKSVFLAESARQLGLSVVVHSLRAEDLAPQSACVVSARALAPLSSLCALASRHLRPGGICAFPKGISADQEIEDALPAWHFVLDRKTSVTDSKASVLFLKGLRHV